MKTSSFAYSFPEPLACDELTLALRPPVDETAQRLYAAGFRALTDVLVAARSDLSHAMTTANSVGQCFQFSASDATVWLSEPSAELVTELRRLEPEAE